MVPENEIMPQLIYMFESRATGREEPGLDGNPVPIVEWDLHQYADMAILKENLTLAIYDKVREALGLESMTSAIEKGKKISAKLLQANLSEIQFDTGRFVAGGGGRWRGQDSLKVLNLSFNYLDGDIPINLLQNENLELLFLHVNNLQGIIPEAVCNREKSIKLLFYSNGFCPPYPECIKYIGKQICSN